MKSSVVHVVSLVGRRRGLTDAEVSVLLSMISGRDNRAIAQAREVTEATVRTQVSSCLHKLGVSCRHEVMLLARLAAEELAEQRGAEDVAELVTRVLEGEVFHVSGSRANNRTAPRFPVF